ncbi:hypothetical protein JW823_02070 [bacterium]|nr:hypothetical protein [candidate division CSSED10-310 bacterium]
MTSINALRLDRHSGLMLCDEARYWNPDWMIFYTPEKIRRVIPDHLTRAYQTVMFMGQTGTSSIGDEWIMEVTRSLAEYFDKTGVSQPDIPSVRLNELAQLAFRTITSIKHMHIDDFLVGKFGFRAADLIRGYQEDREKGRIRITNEEQIKSAVNYMTFAQNPDEVKGIFGNSQILAGYNPDEGFKIFYMTERWPVCEEVHEIFIAQGSGRDTCDLNYARFADNCTLGQRRGESLITRQKGLFTLLKGLHQAMNQTAGIGGYPKIIYINGHNNDPAEWVLEISDCRSKLALEIAAASVDGFMSTQIAEDLIEDLVFKGCDFRDINRRLFESVENPEKLDHYLRKYSN